MAEMKTLKTLMKHAINGTVPAEFSQGAVDINGAIRDELKKLIPDYNAYRRNKYDVFELLQETVDDVLPVKIKSILGMFAEVKMVSDGQKSTFTQKLGKFRAKKFITTVSPAGVYETFRLDKREFELYPQAVGGAFTLDFERMLDGSENMADGYEIIQEGLEDRVYDEVQKALLASWKQVRPVATKQTHAGFDAVKMDKIINHVRAFGSPVIICSPQFASSMSEKIVYKTAQGANPNVAASDLEEIKMKGYVGVYKGVPVVVLPQSFEDEECTINTINPRVAYVMPAGEEKVVKVAFEGNTVIDENKNRDNSYEIQGYKKMAVGIINTKNWGIYQDTSIDATGWEVLA